MKKNSTLEICNSSEEEDDDEDLTPEVNKKIVDRIEKNQ